VTQGFLVPTLSAWKYDDGLPNQRFTNGGDYHGEADTLIGYYIDNMFRRLARHGYLPGITCLQSMSPCNLDLEAGFSMGFKGMATKYNGFFFMLGNASYRDRIGKTLDADKQQGDNAAKQSEHLRGSQVTLIHEFGHVVFKVHAPGLKDGSPASGVRANRHDCATLLVDATGTSTADTNVGQPEFCQCLMAYRNCEGYFCARCLFELQGWNIHTAQMTAGETSAPPSAATV
jgi:hypothetical protein